MFRLYSLLIVLACVLSACGADTFTAGRTLTIPLTDSIRNISAGYYQRYWVLADTAHWEEVMAKADTIVAGPNGEIIDGKIKFRSERIWYEVTLDGKGMRSRYHYPGWELRIDSLDNDLNIMMLKHGRRERVSIPAADLVLGKDSLRIALIHAEGPAVLWSFNEYKPVPDRLLLTTYGNDTFPISTSMACVGEISRQTVFRVNKQYYAINTIADDYGHIEIEALNDPRDLPLTAEIDLNYKAIPVKDIEGNMTSIKRTPGRELLLYFWGGFFGNKRLRSLDSLYHALPEARREEIDLAVISRHSRAEDLKLIIDSFDIKLPMYLSAEKTCLRLNCSQYLPYFVSVNGRGRISSFHDWSKVLEERFEEMKE